MLLNFIALHSFDFFFALSQSEPNTLQPIPLLNHLTFLLSKPNHPSMHLSQSTVYIIPQMERIFSGAWKEKHGDPEQENGEDSTETPNEVKSSMCLSS